MKRVCSVAVSLALSLSGIVLATGLRKIEVPAADLLQAARSIVPQTAPGYTVSGILMCTKVYRPYLYQASCEITIKGKTIQVGNPEPLYEAILNSSYTTIDPDAKLKARFVAESISREAPPYVANEKAWILVK